jgi:hypothetical protein
MRNVHENLVAKIKEQLTTIWNRSGQIVHEVGELDLDLGSLAREAVALAERARTFEPARQRDGYRFIDPAADTSDPRETLAILKERLRRTGENLEKAAVLLEERRETIRSILG